MRAFITLLATCCLAVSGCARRPAEPPPAPKPPRIVFEQPRPTEVTDYEDFTGRTVAAQTVQVRARVTGYLQAVRFTEGAVVNAGDVLFEIDPRPYQAEADRAAAALEQAQAVLVRAGQDLERADTLLPSRTISQQEYQRITAEHAGAAAAVDVAQASLDLARLNLGFTQVRAPLAGRVSRSLLDVGNLVTLDETVLTSLVAVDPMYAYFGVDERLLPKIYDDLERGLLTTQDGGDVPVWMGLAEGSDYPFQGAINFIDNQIDPRTGTLAVRGTFPNPRQKLRPGLFVRVRLPIGEPYDALTIDEAALGTDQGQKFVYVVDAENKVAYRPVQAGKLYSGRRVILEGLSADDRVVVQGLQRVRPGIEVAAEPLAADAATPASAGMATKGEGATARQ